MKKNILFVCGRNKWRSPTAEKIYSRDERINVRSAGVSQKSTRRISEKDIVWADLILVMEEKYKSRIRGEFRNTQIPMIVSLDIPDEYQYMDEDLIELIKAATESVLNEKTGI